MTFPFTKAMDRHVDGHFQKDPSGRLVFLPTGRKGKAYFVDSKSDEEKIRAFVKMYRIAVELVSWPLTLATYVWIVDFTTAAYKWTTVLGIASFFFLLFLLSLWILWTSYKQTVQAFTSSLTEVEPDLKSQLSDVSAPPRRLRVLALVGLFASIALLAMGLILMTRRSSPSKLPCPPKNNSTRPVSG